jgi:hypothetical protein
VALLESTDCKVQRAAAGALRTLAFKNEANKNQVWSQAGCFDGVVWLAGYVAITGPEEKSFSGRNLKVLF